MSDAFAAFYGSGAWYWLTGLVLGLNVGWLVGLRYSRRRSERIAREVWEQAMAEMDLDVIVGAMVRDAFAAATAADPQRRN